MKNDGGPKRITDEPLSHISYLSVFIPHFLGTAKENSGILRKLYVDFNLSMSQIAEISWFSKASVVETLKSQNIQKKGRLFPPPKFGELINSGRERRPHKREQKIIRQMIDMRDGGASFNQIVKWLTSSGVPTKAGGAWHHFTVSEIIKREMNKKEKEKNV